MASLCTEAGPVKRFRLKPCAFAAYNEARRALHTYPLREKWVGDVAAYEAQMVLHTHFVRSGYVMLQPTKRASRLQYPLPEKWVRDVAAYVARLALTIPTS